MTQETILANATLVLPDEIVRGTLVLRDGFVADIAPGKTLPSGGVDCEGDFVAPGLIELHTDNLERHLHPRPKVNWPQVPAILAHDREMASAGITTVFDAIRVGSIYSHEFKRLRKAYAREVATELLALHRQKALKIRHHLHLRAETCSETMIDELEEFGPEDRVGIISLMDHTPGQRQFSDLAKFEAYVRGKYNPPSEGFADYVTFLRDLRSRLGDQHDKAAASVAKRLGATLASHDDTTAEQVSRSADFGVRLAEFPTSIKAAEASRTKGMAIVAGGPNLVRGGSHSGNVAAIDLAKRNLLDIVSSDYVPGSLLLSAVRLGEIWGNMARGLATVTCNPAQALELTDRGRLAQGCVADVIRFRVDDNVPVLNAVWCKGQRVA